MADPKPKQGKGAGLKKKIGPLPLWAWALIAAVVGYFLWTKVLSGGAQPQQQQTAPGNESTPATGGADSSGLGSSSGGVDTSAGGQQSLVDALGGSLAGFAADQQQSNAQFQQSIQDELASYLDGAGGAATSSSNSNDSTQATHEPNSNTTTLTYHKVAAASQNFAQAAAKQSSSLKAAGKAQPFGGVVATHKNAKTGVTTTRYANGRIVTQAPGKSAYVSKKGS